MYRKILAAVNEQVNSEVAGRYAKHLARAAGAKLILCSVHERGQTETTFELARESAKRLQHAARELGVETETIFESGDAVEKIRSLVRAEGIDIVFAATRREDVQHRYYAGRTTARQLLLHLPCSVALVRVVHMGRISPREILVPLKAHIDHIPGRAYFTSLLAKAFESKVHVFHVTRPLRTFFHGEIHLTPVEWDEKVPADLSRFIGHLDGYGIAHEKRLAPGAAGRTITIEAASRRRDLIVMGASERGVLDFILRGNPVEYVLRETPCNLIVLKPGE